MKHDRHLPMAAMAIATLLAQGCDDRPSNDGAPGTTASSEPTWFTDTIADSGIDFIHESGSRGEFRIPEIMCGGVALLDADGDGDLDAYLVQGGPTAEAGVPGGSNQLYLNAGDGTFENATLRAGDAADARYGIGVATGDYDGDGDLDLFVTNLGRNTLLRNEGDGRFTDATVDAGLADEDFSASASFFDADADGHLDLYVCNYLDWTPATEIECKNTLGQRDYCAPMAYAAPSKDRLYRNRGDGTFQDVSESSGIASAPGTGLGVAAADFDGDGREDLFVANDGMPDRLWINRGDMIFEDRALLAGCAMDSSGKPKAGMGVCVEDVDDDGDIDILVCNLWRETDSLFINDGKGYFIDNTTRSGLAATPKTYTRFGIGLHDFDHDGILDLFEANGRVADLSTRHGTGSRYDEPNLVFRGTAGRFREVKPRGGTATALYGTSRGAAFGDLDGDGDLDILVLNRDAPPHLLMNDAPKVGHWIEIDVRQDSGGPAIGAIVTISDRDRRLTRRIRTDGSYLSGSAATAHFGVSPETDTTTVSIEWPGGRRLDLEDVATNQRLRVDPPE